MIIETTEIIVILSRTRI